jgi:hypothetical protein
MAWHAPQRKETPVELQLQVKTDSDGNACWDYSCPSRFKVLDGKGGYVIVGKQLGPADLAQLGEISGDESAVWVPDPVIER